jgi:hypothetical protein
MIHFINTLRLKHTLKLRLVTKYTTFKRSYNIDRLIEIAEMIGLKVIVK